jgi:TPR repeat protein
MFSGVQVFASSDSALDAYQQGRYKIAYKEFRKAAFKGDNDARYNLAVMLYSGKGIPRDKAEAIYWFVKAAESGDQSAQYNLGVLFSTDKELPDEYPKMEDGEIYFEVGTGKPSSNLEKAFKWYKMAAEQGHVSAQLNLGVMYNQGSGVKQDYAEAAKWYQKAADQDNSKAQLNLGILYDLGRGVEKDTTKAAEYYEKAAKKGMRDAQYNLGIIYYNGEGGIKHNYIKSYAWLALAKEQGSELAAIYKDKVEQKLQKMEKLTARKLAVKYYRAHLKPFQK